MVDIDTIEARAESAKADYQAGIDSEWAREYAEDVPAMAQDIRRLREEAGLWRARVIAVRRQEAAGHAARSTGLDWREHKRAQDFLWKAMGEAMETKAAVDAFYAEHPELLDGA